MSSSSREALQQDAPSIKSGRWFGLFFGVVAFVVLYFFTPLPDGMTPQALQVSAVAALMVIWWLSEAVPLAATALVPLVVLPFVGVMPVSAASSAYADPIVFLFMGGFILAIGLERWGLHRRIALNIVRVVGSNANAVIGGFMLATALLSMWISNTATVVMMMPIALSVVQLLMRGGGEEAQGQGVRNFATCMMLGLAVAANIGGIATLVGTPPNAVFAGYVHSTYGIEIGFAQWMMLAGPIAAVLLLVGWVLLLDIYPNNMGHIEGAERIINYELLKLGPWSRGEKMVAVIFFSTALMWVFRSPLNTILPVTLNDAGIGMMGALALLVIPVSRHEMLLSWQDAERLPWGILLLFGGGLCLASAVSQSQLAEWVGLQIQSVVNVSPFVMVLIVAGVILWLTEFMSNVATITTFLPVIGAVALAFGYPALDLMIPATLAASCAFMMPVATPPNAVVFASGHVKIRQMAYSGFILNLLAWAIIPAACYVLMDYAFR
jgi:solute carrier family 13 (sodium-dependent dicarboxylate transporter), member 2/3/5